MFPNLFLLAKLANQPTSTFSTSPFGLTHSNIWGPAPIPTVSGFRYFVVFVDDYSCFTWICMFKHRSTLSQMYIAFANMIHTQFSRKLKSFAEIVQWNIRIPIFFLFSLNKAPLSNAHAPIVPNKMVE